jgi:hypothetical protein
MRSDDRVIRSDDRVACPFGVRQWTARARHSLRAFPCRLSLFCECIVPASGQDATIAGVGQQITTVTRQSHPRNETVACRQRNGHTRGTPTIGKTNAVEF